MCKSHSASRLFCARCECELTSADAEAGSCTQCGFELRLTKWDWRRLVGGVK